MDTLLLVEKIRSSGYRLSYLADQLGMSRQALGTRLLGEVDFRATEVCKLMEMLHLTSEERLKIFFPENVDRLSTKEDLECL